MNNKPENSKVGQQGNDPAPKNRLKDWLGEVYEDKTVHDREAFSETSSDIDSRSVMQVADDVQAALFDQRKLRSCSVCGGAVSRRAISCVHCGDPSWRGEVLTLFLMGLAICFFLFLLYLLFMKLGW